MWTTGFNSIFLKLVWKIYTKKLINQIPEKLHKVLTFQLKFWGKTLIFSQHISVTSSIKLWEVTYFPWFWNLLTLHLYLKKVLGDLKKTVVLLIFYQLFLKSLKKLIDKQLTAFMDPLLSKYQCRFGRGFSTQNCLLVTLEK